MHDWRSAVIAALVVAVAVLAWQAHTRSDPATDPTIAQATVLCSVVPGASGAAANEALCIPRMITAAHQACDQTSSHLVDVTVVLQNGDGLPFVGAVWPCSAIPSISG